MEQAIKDEIAFLRRLERRYIDKAFEANDTMLGCFPRQVLKFQYESYERILKNFNKQEDV